MRTDRARSLLLPLSSGLRVGIELGPDAPGRPKIFNTDQGAQFTADAFTACLHSADIQVSMDGRGRALDNVFCERLWRSVKYENIYLNQYDTVLQLQAGLTAYFDFYNQERPHQSPDYRTPAEEHFALCPEPAAFVLP